MSLERTTKGISVPREPLVLARGGYQLSNRSEWPGEPVKGGLQPLEFEHVRIIGIASESLIPTFPGEDDLHVLPRKFGDIVESYCWRFVHGLLHVPNVGRQK